MHAHDFTIIFHKENTILLQPKNINRIDQILLISSDNYFVVVKILRNKR